MQRVGLVAGRVAPSACWRCGGRGSRPSPRRRRAAPACRPGRRSTRPGGRGAGARAPGSATRIGVARRRPGRWLAVRPRRRVALIAISVARPLLDDLHRLDVVGLLAERDARDAEQIGGELEQRRRDLLLARDVGGDADVLVEQREPEGAREGAREHALGEEVHRRVRPAARRVDDVERDLRAPRRPWPAPRAPRRRTRCAPRAARCSPPSARRRRRLSPQWTIFWPNASSTGRTRSSDAPRRRRTITVSVPCSAPLTPAAHRRVEEADPRRGEARGDPPRGRRDRPRCSRRRARRAAGRRAGRPVRRAARRRRATSGGR